MHDMARGMRSILFAMYRAWLSKKPVMFDLAPAFCTDTEASSSIFKQRVKMKNLLQTLPRRPAAAAVNSHAGAGAAALYLSSLLIKLCAPEPLC